MEISSSNSNSNNIKCSKVQFYLPTSVVCSDLMVCKNLSASTFILIQSLITTSTTIPNWTPILFESLLSESKYLLCGLWPSAIANNGFCFAPLAASHMNQISFIQLNLCFVFAAFSLYILININWANNSPQWYISSSLLRIVFCEAWMLKCG